VSGTKIVVSLRRRELGDAAPLKYFPTAPKTIFVKIEAKK
jgi:hypothetical protein